MRLYNHEVYVTAWMNPSGGQIYFLIVDDCYFSKVDFHKHNRLYARTERGSRKLMLRSVCSQPRMNNIVQILCRLDTLVRLAKLND